MSIRKEYEDKRRRDELEAAHVFEQFIETFHPTNNTNVLKTWVKAGVINPVNSKINEETPSIYKPVPKFQSLQEKSGAIHAQEIARILPPSTSERKADNSSKKKKSNLESFKEELAQIHKEREERQKHKEDLKLYTKAVENIDTNCSSVEHGDPTSTNLYVNNLCPKITELQLMELFGKYGPLASVKIMWPRSEEERNRNKNCGFVAYMSRKDAERGLKNLNGKVLFDCELRVGWGKTVVIPSYPVFIPKILLDNMQPPPQSGLPFNAQLPKLLPDNVSTFEEILKYCVIKVVIPTDRYLLSSIHRMIEFVVREGMLFEAIIMEKEQHNSSFRFLFDNQSPAHVYYRWKLYSVLHGDSIYEWDTREFRMYENGPIWKPPVFTNYSQGMPEELLERDEKNYENMKKTLSFAQRNHFEYLLHKLTPENGKIKEGFIFCIEHKEAAEEIVECISQAIQNTANIYKICARIYLMYDLLYNCKEIHRMQLFKQKFEKYLPKIMFYLNQIYENLPNRTKTLFYNKISRIFKGMYYHMMFPIEYIEFLNNIFTNKNSSCAVEQKTEEVHVEEIEPVEVEEISFPEVPDTKMLPGFIPCKWEIVNPDIVESQAMTTSKWSQLPDSFSSGEDDIKTSKRELKSKEISENKRKKLREIEVKVMEYQDELEKDYGTKNIDELVERYRNKLIKQYEEKSANSEKKSKKNKYSPKKSKSNSRKSGKY